MYNRYIENRDKYLNVLYSLLMTLIELSTGLFHTFNKRNIYSGNMPKIYKCVT